ncbi:hypothetical protein QU487_06500 [Crenobacter sp. SG2305]|uniref:hypothetical protein n=1 Tax=Crenobacter oryzisoli TaxID=3056844 RepID=UPI0025AB0264|nr:hypothetical protein [Crenobacter sp. SG2305]MDN0082403.1 hypothetical protein [Crenobacter sp. SG2305]
MKITEEMIQAAAAFAPELPLATVQRMLEAATQGQFIFADDAGAVIENGKTHWPALLHVQINDPFRALEYSQQLMTGARRRLENPSNTLPITLMLAGDVELSE